MEYFNQQEEVLEIQLTQYGKFLLSKGEFSPVYYAFYDDDIVYDSSYIGLVEGQNQAVARITGSTPRLKTQYNFKGVETEYNRMWEIEDRFDTQALDRPDDWSDPVYGLPDPDPDDFFAGLGAAPEDAEKVLMARDAAEIHWKERTGRRAGSTIKPYSEKEFSLHEPMGRSDPGSSHRPAWQVNIIEGSSSAMTPTYTVRSGRKNETYKMQIPQINLKMTYETSVKKLNIEDSTQRALGERGIVQSGQISEEWGPSDTYLHLTKENMLVSLLEENVLFKNKNFDIEVFEIEERLINEAGQYDETLIPLKFAESEFTEITPSHVEYYFDLFVDEEVITDVLPSTSNNYVIADNPVEECD